MHTVKDEWWYLVYIMDIMILFPKMMDIFVVIDELINSYYNSKPVGSIIFPLISELNTLVQLLLILPKNIK